MSEDTRTVVKIILRGLKGIVSMLETFLAGKPIQGI
jgi:hypothetical protein